jgi:hypothetical protein
MIKMMDMTMKCPLVWHTKIMSSAINIHARVDGPTRDKFALMATKHRAESLKLLQTEIRRCETGRPDDRTISAVLTLALHERVFPARPEIHPQSPLATLTNLHIYGRLGFEAHHMNALYLLVEQMGGVDCVDEVLSRGLLQR